MVGPPPSVAPTRLVLTGFMGSGKTTVGRQLAQQLDWTFVDLDDHVALREGYSVPTLIAERGEAGFRLAEVEALQDLLGRSALVIALGGGAPETPAVHTLLEEAAGTFVVYLEAPFAGLYERCLLQDRDPSATKRPLLTDPASTAARYQRRTPLYERLAHLTVAAAEADPATIAGAICAALGS